METTSAAVCTAAVVAVMIDVVMIDAVEAGMVVWAPAEATESTSLGDVQGLRLNHCARQQATHAPEMRPAGPQIEGYTATMHDDLPL